MENFLDSDATTSAGGFGAQNRALFDTTDEIDELILSLLPPDEVDNLQQEAAAFVGRSLQLQQDVQSRAQDLLVDVTRDRDDALQALRSVTTDQLSSVRKGMDRFSSAERAMQELAAAFSQMDALIGTMQSVSSYHQIRQLHHYHENLSGIIKWSECLDAFDPEKSTVEKDLNDDETCDANKLLEIYHLLRVLQSVRARLAIPSVASHNRISVNIIKKNLLAGEQALEVFLDKIWAIFRKSPSTLVDFVLSENSARAKREHELLVAAVKIANQEALEPGIFSDIDIAAYHLEIAINRTAGKTGVGGSSSSSSRRGGGGGGGHYNSNASSSSSAARVIARPDTEVISRINWDEISHHVEVGTRSLFIDSVCRDASQQERAELPTDELLADVTATCDTIEDQLDAICECVERGMESVPVGSGVQLLPHIMKTLHHEFSSLIESDYCDPRSNVIVSDLLRVLKLVVFYREQCLERGTIGQFVPPAGVERVATRVLEVAVSGMRDYLATNARNCVIRVTDKDVAPDPRTGQVGTTGPGDLLYVVSTMLKSVTKNASNEVRTKMSLACATALRYYVDRFCEKLRWENFPTWYKKIVEARGAKLEEVANLGDRWVLWLCTAINDFLELQRNIGKLDASLFDLHHQATAAVAAAAAVSSSASQQQQQQQQSSSSVSSHARQSPLQAFSSTLARDVLRKLVSHISDYLELHSLKKIFDDATSESSFKPTSDKRGAMRNFVEEVRGYAVESIQPLVATPWNAVCSRNIIFRMIQLYMQRVLARIYDGLDSKVTRSILTARLGDDLRLWTGACGGLVDVVEEQLRAEERDSHIVPDIRGALGALRVILRFAHVDSADAFRSALDEDAIFFHDIPDYVFLVMFEKNKAAGDLSSSTKSSMKKMWKAHLDEMNTARKEAEQAKQQAAMSAAAGGGSGTSASGLTAGDDSSTGMFMSQSSVAALDDNDGGDDKNHQQQQQSLATAEMIQRLTTPTIFGGLDEEQIIPKKKGWFGNTRDDSVHEIGYRLGQVAVCHESIVIREQTTTIPRLKRKDEVEVISFEELKAQIAAKEAAKAAQE